MAALTRATKANYVLHESIEAETTDREDHTFCGIMFPIKCKEVLPVDHVVIHSVAVRGALGPLTVWVTKDDNLNGEISMSKKHWTKLYEKTHAPSFVGYEELDFSSNPIIMRPGNVRGIYVHSTRRGDEAIVYDNKEKPKTHDDSFITMLPGRAHVSEKVFGSIPIWGWGSAWRDNREFVGRIKYGACYRLWNPSENPSFGGNFRTAARTLFLCQRRTESPFSDLPDDCIYFILNMMRWDWVDDTSDGLRRERRDARRARRLRAIAEADALMIEAEAEAGGGEDSDAEFEDAQDGVQHVVGGMDDDDVFYEDMDEDSSDDSEDADSSDDDNDDDDGSGDSDSESAASSEYAWGDHVSSRNALIYNHDTDSSSDSEGEAGMEDRARRSALIRARRSILRFLQNH